MKREKKSGVSINSTSKPQAWVAVLNSRQKIYGENKVYLDDSQEFQIELFNPTNKSYLTKIYLNGVSISSSGLVIKPGQRYFLDRFIDEKKKLVFSTYDVENTDEIRKAIQNNGKIRVEFYPEQTPPIYNSNTFYSGITLSGTSPYYGTTTTSNTSYISTTGSYSIPVAGSFSGFGNSSSGTVTSSVAYSSNLSSNNSVNFTSNLETGRIERGGSSNQEFGNDYGSYSSWIEHTSEYQIMPRSTRPVEISEIRSYCPGCGTRIKKTSWKFCPSCGESLT